MSYNLYRPQSLAEASLIQLSTSGRYLAGGTVTLVNYHKGKDIGTDLISLDRIPELRGIRFENGVLTVGAYVTMDEIEESELVKNAARALWEAAREVGGPQIRNRATLGGNLASASPSSDCATPLLAMNARLNVYGNTDDADNSDMYTVPLRDFFLGRFRHVLPDDHIIVSVSVDCPDGSRSSFRKVGARSALSVSCLNMAVFRCGDRTDVAVGAAAPRPVYCAKTSELLSGTPDLAAAQAALQEEICPIDDRWATASYRRTVSANLLEDMTK